MGLKSLRYSQGYGIMTERDKESSSSLAELLGSLARTPEVTVTYLRGKATDFDAKKC